MVQLSRDTRTITFRGRTFPRDAFAHYEGTQHLKGQKTPGGSTYEGNIRFGQNHPHASRIWIYNFMVAVLSYARWKSWNDKELYDQLDKALKDCELRLELWLDAMELSFLSEDCIPAEEPIIRYRVSEGVYKMCKHTGAYETDSDILDFMKNTYKVEPSLPRQWDAAMQELERYNESLKGTQQELFDD